MCRTFFPFTDMIPDKMHSCLDIRIRLKPKPCARSCYATIILLPWQSVNHQSFKPSFHSVCLRMFESFFSSIVFPATPQSCNLQPGQRQLCHMKQPPTQTEKRPSTVLVAISSGSKFQLHGQKRGQASKTHKRQRQRTKAKAFREEGGDGSSQSQVNIVCAWQKPAYM